MSKKNKKSTRRNRHAFDLANEKADQEKRQENLEKKESKGIQKPRKAKTYRIRKGVRVGGIVVKDAETKKKARKLLAARAALKMEVDEDAPAKATKKMKVGGGIKIKAKAAKAAAGGTPAAAGAMDTE